MTESNFSFPALKNSCSFNLLKTCPRSQLSPPQASHQPAIVHIYPSIPIQADALVGEPFLICEWQDDVVFLREVRR